jgi:hypothetical protein
VADVMLVFEGKKYVNTEFEKLNPTSSLTQEEYPLARSFWMVKDATLSITTGRKDDEYKEIIEAMLDEGLPFLITGLYRRLKSMGKFCEPEASVVERVAEEMMYVMNKIRFLGEIEVGFSETESLANFYYEKFREVKVFMPSNVATRSGAKTPLWPHDCEPCQAQPHAGRGGQPPPGTCGPREERLRPNRPR